MNDLSKRLPTTAVLIVFTYSAIRFLPLIYFSALIYILISLAAVELITLTQPRLFSWPLVFFNGLLIALAFTVKQVDLLQALTAALIASGLFYLFTVTNQQRLESFVRDMGINALTAIYLYIPLYFLFALKKLGANGNYLFFLIFVIAMGDSGAYFIGRAFGKHKIYPLASPKKSLEGLVAAVLTAALSGWLSIWLFPLKVKISTAMISAAIIGLFSQLSDPVESLFKRASGKKDSSHLLPGHGGILDRVDSYIFCAPLLYYIMMYFWK
ncbi:MAG: phosphatidate cytidylyltransferase [Candidatus Aminicenantes bacterium]|nr:phosphatidate cytidylyltransferase [Candidatus Aminicenantes bacterium]